MRSDIFTSLSFNWRGFFVFILILFSSLSLLWFVQYANCKKKEITKPRQFSKQQQLVRTSRWVLSATTECWQSWSLWQSIIKTKRWVSLTTIKKYTQAFYIDWAIFQNCPINVKIYATFFFALENYPINVKCLHIGYMQAFYIDWVLFKIYLGSFQYGNLPNQCKMLAHNLCASILHWLDSFQDARLAFFYPELPDIYPINVKCLHTPYVQAFYIDWVKFPNFYHYSRNKKCPINVKFLQQAFYID